MLVELISGVRRVFLCVCVYVKMLQEINEYNIWIENQKK